jgi:hypothetical protein
VDIDWEQGWRGWGSSEIPEHPGLQIPGQGPRRTEKASLRAECGACVGAEGYAECCQGACDLWLTRHDPDQKVPRKILVTPGYVLKSLNKHSRGRQPASKMAPRIPSCIHVLSSNVGKPTLNRFDLYNQADDRCSGSRL